MCVCGYDCSKKAMFWDSEGVILAHFVPKGTIVTGQSYEDVLRRKCLPALREKRPKMLQLCSFIKTAPAHRAARVHQFFDDNNFEVVPHAPY